MNFKVGDRVDVQDKRDGTWFERGALIEALAEATPEEQKAGCSGVYASLSCGFSVSTRCLRPAS